MGPRWAHGAGRWGTIYASGGLSPWPVADDALWAWAPTARFGSWSVDWELALRQSHRSMCPTFVSAWRSVDMSNIIRYISVSNVSLWIMALLLVHLFRRRTSFLERMFVASVQCGTGMCVWLNNLLLRFNAQTFCPRPTSSILALKLHERTNKP